MSNALDKRVQSNGHKNAHQTQKKNRTQWKLKQKCIKDLNIKAIQLLEENIHGIFFDINHGKIPFDLSPRVMEIKAKINKWDLKASDEQRKL